MDLGRDGATTFITMTLNLTTLGIDIHDNTAECCILITVILSVVILSAVIMNVNLMNAIMFSVIYAKCPFDVCCCGHC